MLTSCGVSDQIVSLVQPSKRVLFIGNSYTQFNGGVDQQLKGLAPTMAASEIAVGGYTLENHWNDSNTISAIRSEKWDYVVLQEQSQTPVSDPAKFGQYAEKLNAEIKNDGAQTILFMTWQRPDSVAYGVTTANLANQYYALGNRIGVKVAPVGLAFASALQQRPDLVLYSQDGHPTVQGTYLAACVFYGIILGQSPVGNTYSDSNITEADRTFLQQVAADTLGY